MWTLRYRPAHAAWQLVNRNSGKRAAMRVAARAKEPALQLGCADDPWMLWRI
ncbi:hypothetical protein [Streptomyces sp. NPDC048603]|uniref:hypothetical protein n=1 Tax=Streptomyces sp. NPDC048603 TaxID=3365577 RepID=UPI003718A848